MSSHESMVSVARFAAALLAGVVIFGSGPARAQEQPKRIVVMTFTGAGANHVQSAAAELLREQGHELVPERQYRQTARQQRARQLTAENVALVSGELGADAVLVGQVERVAGQRLATLRLLAGKTGAEVGEIRLELRRRRPGQEELEELRVQLQSAMLALAALDAPEPEPEDDADDDITFAPDAISDAPPIVMQESPAAAATRPRVGLAMTMGFSFTSRILRSSTASGNASGPTYTGDPAPGLLLDAEIYPFAFGTPARDILTRLGVRLIVDRVFALRSELPYIEPAEGMEMKASLGTTQMRVGLGLLYRHAFGTAPTAPVLQVGAGYDRLQFSVDKDDAPAGIPVNLPNVTYSSFDPYLSFRYPLSEVLALTGTGRLLLIASTGEMGRADQLGDGSTTGFDLSAQVEYHLAARLALRAGLRFLNISAVFDGNGAPSMRDVIDITDRYIGGHLTAGYVF